MPRMVFRTMAYEEARNAAWRKARPRGFLSIPKAELDALYETFCREFDAKWYPKYGSWK